MLFRSVPTLQGPCGLSPKQRGSLRFLPPLEMRPSSIATNPADGREPWVPLICACDLRELLRMPMRIQGYCGPVHRPQRPAGSTHSSTRGLRPPEQLERPAGFPSSDKTRPESPVPTLQGPCGLSPKQRGSLRFLPPLEVRPSSVAPARVMQDDVEVVRKRFDVRSGFRS